MSVQPRRARNLETYSVAIFSHDLGLSNELQRKLKRLINYITVFLIEDDVKNYIQENKYDLIILIISIELAEIIIKCTHDLKQLCQIYIYNPMNTTSQWTNDYEKIQAVAVSSDTLLEILGTKYNPMSIDQESFLKFDRFTAVIWYLPFIQLLINLNQENNDRQALIDYLKVYCIKLKIPVEKVLEFEREYVSLRAINWYTRNSFVYRILNKAFRSFDMEILILFRFFIADLYHQLHSLYDEKNTPNELTCYRGQQMYRSEIKALEIDQRICSTSFLSTTRNYNLAKTCQIIGNIYCILANVHREMKNYSKALEFYQRAVKTHKRNYFIEKDRCFWAMYIYKTKLNSFVKDDKYFYYCDRPLLNMVLLYKRTRQWDLARDTFQKVLQDYFEHQRNGDVEMFVKILSDNEENSDAHALIENNRAFLGARTFPTFLNQGDNKCVLYAYEELARHYLNHHCPDHALRCYQEILACQNQMNSLLNPECFDGIGRVHEMKEEYTDAINWFKKAMDISINHISKIDSSWRRIYQKLLLIFNQKLNDPLSAMVYMKEIINHMIEKHRNHLDKRNDFIATILKITVHFYHSNDKTKIASICDYGQEVLDQIEINDDGWKKWLCIGSICDLKKFQDDNYHHCQPIIDENYNTYLKLYNKIFAILSNDTSDDFKTERSQCEQLFLPLKIIKLDRRSAVLKLWKSSNEQMNLQRTLTRSLSQSSFFLSTTEHRCN